MTIFTGLKNTFKVIMVSAVVLTAAGAHAAADEAAVKAFSNAEPIFAQKSDMLKAKRSKALLFFNYTNRQDLNILTEFFITCENFEAVSCFAADVSGKSKESIAAFFKDSKIKQYIYKTEGFAESPYAIFIKGGKTAGVIEQDGYFKELSPVYMTYLAGNVDEARLEEMLDAVEKGEYFKKVVPRLNFVLMLSKKGENDAAVKELDKVDISQLDDKGKLLLGQTYLRLKSPEKAISVFSACPASNECVFFSGVAYYYGGDNEKALKIFNGLKGKYEDTDKLNFYLQKLEGTKKDGNHAE